MLEDRDYMRDPSYEGRWSLTTILIVVNAVAFVLHHAIQFYTRTQAINELFALSLAGLRQGYFWQPITYQFMHSGLFHLLANLVTIYFFGRPIEHALGKAGFLKIYFGAGLFGGLLQVFASVLLPKHFLDLGVVGASAGAFGLVAAFATLYPERSLTLLLFFILPVSLRAKYLLYIELALTLFGMAVPMDNIAHVAHLGGILAGLGFVRWGTRLNWETLSRPFKPRLKVVPHPKGVTELRLRRAARDQSKLHPSDLPSAEFISREVDPILDKISAHGIQSLTPRERRILEAASAKIEKH